SSARPPGCCCARRPRRSGSSARSASVIAPRWGTSSSPPGGAAPSWTPAPRRPRRSPWSGCTAPSPPPSWRSRSCGWWCDVAELVFFAGTMDSGKSTLALQMDYNYRRRGLEGVIFSRNDRAGTGTLSSRLGLSVEAVEADDTTDFWQEVVTRRTRGGRVDYLVCDEAQFYSVAQVEQIHVETLCWCGRRATHNARTVGGRMVREGQQVVVGDTEVATGGGDVVGYEVLCRLHHVRGMTAATAGAAELSPPTLPLA